MRSSGAGWYMSTAILNTQGTERQEEHEFQAGLGYATKACLKTKQLSARGWNIILQLVWAKGSATNAGAAIILQAISYWTSCHSTEVVVEPTADACCSEREGHYCKYIT